MKGDQQLIVIAAAEIAKLGGNAQLWQDGHQ